MEQTDACVKNDEDVYWMEWRRKVMEWKSLVVRYDKQ